MNVYNLSNTNLFIHGKISFDLNLPLSVLNNYFIMLTNYVSRLKRNKKYHNMPLTFIVTGNCGFGFHEESYYHNLIQKHNSFFAENDCYVLFLRGCDDNPVYFSEEKINYSHIKTIPDYSIVITNNNTTLCVGGGISRDADWKRDFQAYIHQFDENKEYTLCMENTQINFDSNILTDIINSNYKINSIITYTAPSCITNKTNKKNNIWNKTERVEAYKILEFLQKNNSIIKFWAYGQNNESRNFTQVINDQNIHFWSLPTDRSCYFEANALLDEKDNAFSPDFFMDYIVTA